MFTDNVRSILINTSLVVSSIICIKNFIIYYKNKKKTRDGK